MDGQEERIPARRLTWWLECHWWLPQQWLVVSAAACPSVCQPHHQRHFRSAPACQGPHEPGKCSADRLRARQLQRSQPQSQHVTFHFEQAVATCWLATMLHAGLLRPDAAVAARAMNSACWHESCEHAIAQLPCASPGRALAAAQLTASVVQSAGLLSARLVCSADGAGQQGLHSQALCGGQGICHPAQGCPP